MNRFSFRSKILFLCGGWVVVLALVGTLIFFNQQTQDRILISLNDSRNLTTQYTDLLNIMINMETGIRGYLLAGSEDYLEPFNKNEALFDQRLRSLMESATENQKKNLEDIGKSKQSWMETASEQMIGKKKFDRAMITHADFIGVFKASKGKVFSERIQADIAKEVQNEIRRVEALSASYASYSRLTRILITGVLPITVFLGLSLLVFMVMNVTKKLTGLALNLEKLSMNLFKSANEVSEFSKAISIAAKHQADNLQQTSASMVEISSIVKQNSNKALEADRASQDSVFVGKSTESNIRELVDATKDVKVSSQRISDIVTTVDEIAFQTNLLALNASVEAARSGEHGKGFAVVADSIRTLAQRAAKATQEISELISDNSRKTAISLEKLELNKTNVERLVSSLGQIANLVTEVASAGGHQSKGIEQMTQTLSQIDEALQKNASVSKSSGAVVEDIFDQSKELVLVVDSVKEILHGRA